MTTALRSQIDWLSFDDKINLLQRWNLLRSILQWHNERQMNHFIWDKLDERYSKLRTQHEINDFKHDKSLVDLALNNYIVTKETAN